MTASDEAHDSGQHPTRIYCMVFPVVFACARNTRRSFHSKFVARRRADRRKARDVGACESE